MQILDHAATADNRHDPLPAHRSPFGPLDRWRRCREVAEDYDLSVTEAAMLGSVAFYDGGRGCHASISVMAAGVGLSERPARRALTALCAKGLLQARHRPGRTSKFRLSEIFVDGA